MYCKNCGNQIENDSKFCSFCGNSINTLEKKLKSPIKNIQNNEHIEEYSVSSSIIKTNSKLKSKRTRALLTALIVVVLIGGVFLYKLKEKEDLKAFWDSSIYIYVNTIEYNVNDIIGYELGAVNMLVENSNLSEQDIYRAYAENEGSSILATIKEQHKNAKETMNMLQTCVNEKKIPNAFYETLFKEIKQIESDYNSYYALFNYGNGKKHSEDSWSRTEKMITLLDEIRSSLNNSFSNYLIK